MEATPESPAEPTPQTLTAMMEAGVSEEEIRAALKAQILAELPNLIEEVPEAGADAATKAVDAMRSGMDGIRSLFAELVPPTDIVLVDSLGNKYEVGSTTSAAAQIKLMRELEAVLGAEENASAFKATYGKGSWSEAIQAVTQAMSNSDVMDGLATCFKASRPRTFVMAKRAWIAEFEDIREEAGLPADGDLTAADLFPLEEIAAGLVPFFVRFAHRTVGLVTSLIPAPTETT